MNNTLSSLHDTIATDPRDLSPNGDGEAYSTAIHEAAHGVAFFLAGIKIYSLSVKPTGNSLGRISKSPHVRNETELWYHVVGLFAGSAGETRLAVQVNPALDTPDALNAYYVEQQQAGGTSDDFAEITAVLNARAENEEQFVAWAARAYWEAYMLIDGSWPAIEAVAGELLEKRYLRAGRARKIIRSFFEKNDWRRWRERQRHILLAPPEGWLTTEQS